MPVHAVWLTPDAAEKLKKIRRFISLSRLIQQRLLEFGGYDSKGDKIEEAGPEVRRGPKPKNAKRTSIYLSDSADKILRQYKEELPAGFNFRQFVLREIDRYFRQLQEEKKIKE